MNYGYFDDSAREYVITRPDTPRAWSNYLGSRRYGGIITNNAGGYSFTRSPAAGRILRYRYNSVPMDMPGRQFYLRDAATGDLWSAAWQPAGKPLAEFKSTCRFGTGYAVIESEYSGIRMESTYLIPLDAEFEYWLLKLTNTGSTPRRLSVFSFCEFTTEWNLLQDLLNLQYTQFIANAEWQDGFIQASSVRNLPHDPTNFANRDQSRYWWMTQVGGRVVGFDADREKFIGPYGSFARPDAVADGACTNAAGASDNICGAIQSDVELVPGASTEVLVMLGIGKVDTVARPLRSAHGTPARCREELARLKSYWHERLGALQVRTPDTEFDHMVNVWNAYNALVTFEWSRSCSLVYTGDQRDGFGYRDTVQDMLGVCGMLPETVRERLILMISGQDATGGAQPEIRPWLHRPGAMPPTKPEEYRSDDCLWLFNTVPAYVAETGDLGFFDLVVPYADKGEASVFGHMRRALEFNLERTGRNGLPCGLLADWNDCLKLGYRGESVFVTFQVRYGLKMYAEIAQALHRPAERDWALAELKTLDAKIGAVCWDGDWFIWAIAEDGTVFGTKRYPEGQVYLNTQVWAVLSGAATAEQTDRALDTVKSRLASEWGISLCQPPFRNTPITVMRAVLFNPGTKENGGIFSHTQSWAVLAEIARGNGDQAYAYYRAFMPAAQNDKAEIREIEPYAHCQSTHAPQSPKHGRSRIPWLSGTASWSYFTAAQYILGVRPELDGLRIDPCIPREWPGFTAVRKFRGKTIRIEVKNPARLNRGVRWLLVDGKRIEGNLIKPEHMRDGSTVTATLE